MSGIVIFPPCSELLCTPLRLVRLLEGLKSKETKAFHIGDMEDILGYCGAGLVRAYGG